MKLDKQLPEVFRDETGVSSKEVLALIERGGERFWTMARFIKECNSFSAYDRWQDCCYGTVIYPLTWTDLPPTEVV